MKLDKLISDRGTKKIYRDGDLAIKVFENEAFSKADILNEACNQARVEDLKDLHIPRIREVGKIDGKWAIATEFVEGKTLQELMDKNPKKEDEYLELFVDLQIKVHSHTVANLNSQKEKMQRKISQSALDATARYELHTRLAALRRTIKYATAILTRRILLSTRRAFRTSLTGHMLPQETLPRTLQEPIFCSALRARTNLRRST